jgi:hypothetical protein
MRANAAIWSSLLGSGTPSTLAIGTAPLRLFDGRPAAWIRRRRRATGPKCGVRGQFAAVKAAYLGGSRLVAGMVEQGASGHAGQQIVAERRRDQRPVRQEQEHIAPCRSSV